MADLVKDWQDIERYTQQMEYWVKIGSYQLKKSTEGTETSPTQPTEEVVVKQNYS